MPTSQQQQIAKNNQAMEAAASQLPLAKTAKDIVPGEGNANAEVLFIGEAPGFHEAEQRRPFVGRSGQFLRKTITEVGLNPEDVYISNIVKARPPENRDPSAAEIAAYKPFLDKEIEIVDPILIVTLGRFSMAKFLPDVRISQVHGRLHKVTWQDKKLYVLPMYHPAAGLRSTNVRNSFIADFEKIQKVIDWVHEQLSAEDFKSVVASSLL